MDIKISRTGKKTEGSPRKSESPADPMEKKGSEGQKTGNPAQTEGHPTRETNPSPLLPQEEMQGFADVEEIIQTVDGKKAEELVHTQEEKLAEPPRDEQREPREERVKEPPQPKAETPARQAEPKQMAETPKQKPDRKARKQEKKQKAEAAKKEKTKGQIIGEWLRTILIPIFIALIILQVIRPTLVQQQSMMPTVQPNNYLIVYKLAYKFGHNPQNGDIIVFESDLKTETDTAKYLIKRVIATEGQTIQITDGQVYVDGEQLSEPYINGDFTPGDILPTEIPSDCVFVMGDNRPNSTDSRSESVGFVKEETIMGKVIFRLFPFNEIGSVYE